MADQFLIIGAGIAGLTAAETIRENRPSAKITIVDASAEASYIRPLLSKTWMRAFDPENLVIHDDSWYARKKIERKRNCRAVRISPAEKTVQFHDGSTESYHKLIYAAGAVPFVPPIPGAQLDGVFTVRDISDLRRIHRAAATARHAVIIGGGVIGVEMAEELKAQGVHVTVLESMEQLIGRILDKESSLELRDTLASSGITCLTNMQITEIAAGENGRVSEVRCFCRNQPEEKLAFPAEIVILSCGVKPCAQVLKDAGAKGERGVAVNERMETSLRDIYAAGDCIEWVSGNPGLWNFAKESGRIAALSAVMEKRSNADVFAGAKAELILSGRKTFLYAYGDLRGEGVRQCLEGGGGPRHRVNEEDFSTTGYKKLFYHGGRLCGAVFINTTEGFAQVREELVKNCGFPLDQKMWSMPASMLLFGAAFFWRKTTALSLLSLLPDWKEHSPQDWSLEYDYLFRGCDADFKAPLWASVCRNEKVLCNQTTLDVIRSYYAAGYRPVYMDGNPADYIGEQLRFLYYMKLAGAEESLCLFEEKYTMDNQRLLADALEARGTFRSFLRICDCLLGVLSGSREDSVSAFLDVMGASENLQKVLDILKPFADDFAEIPEAGQNAPIAMEPAKAIPTGGWNNCGGKCVIIPTVQEGCMLRIESDTSGNDPQIRACVRGRGYRKTFLSMDRLRYPMQRVGERGSGKFRRISWEEAVKGITAEWKRIRDSYGPASRYVNYASGITAIMRPNKLAMRLLSADGGYMDAFGNYSSACASYIGPYIFGDAYFGNSPSDFLNTSLLVFWGDNSAETIFGSERNYYLSKLKEKGIPVIVIDPRFSQTAVAYADEWIPIRPSTDSAFADAVAYTILKEHRQDQHFMDTYCQGFDEAHMPEGVPDGESYESYLFGRKDNIEKNPSWAEKITGIPAETIVRFARILSSAKPACIVAGHGIQRTGNGEQATKAIAMLAALTGNIGISGGNAGGNGLTAEHNNPMLRYAPLRNPYSGSISMFLWTKAIEHGTEMTPRDDRLKGVDRLDTNIKMILNLAGNTLVNQHSDINDTIRILKDESLCELIVCSDIFMTSSARYGDYVLPSTSVFETSNISAPWRGGNYLIKNNKVMEPIFECRYDWEWMKDIAAELGVYDAFTAGLPDMEDWLRENYNLLREKESELPDYDTFCRLGNWQYRAKKNYIAYEKEIADPAGHPFKTPSGKIEIFSKVLYDMQLPDVPAIPRYVPCPEGPEDPVAKEYPLQLIGWHTRRRCHSVHDNNEWQDEIEMPGVWIHPDDAADRNIENGEIVEVFNARGRVHLPAVVTGRIMKGVVAMAQGGWYTPDQNGVDQRGSINVLTDAAHPTPLAKGNPQHTNLVQVKKK